MDTKEIREKYLRYFEKQGHKIVPTCPLVPENDPTTLFTGSGMQPMIPYLLGQTHPLGTRITDSQKCLRTQDIDEVGDNRHTTFFEMLGNWSLNDYFKQEQIGWMFDFLTKEIGLNPENLYASVFRGSPECGIDRDSETVEIWKKFFAGAGINAKDIDFAERDGMQGGKIFYYDEKKNWWSRSGVPPTMPEGELGGPDSEIFWDFGAELLLHENSPWKDLPCHINCDCGRFLEIGNNVFMEYVKRNGQVEKMPTHNVDFGGGLERMAAASQNDPDIFKIDLFKPIIGKMEQLSGKKYGADAKTTNAMRVISDHIRSAVFLIADGVIPSNKAQGYFTRRLIRRAVVKGQELGINKNFMAQIAVTVCAAYGQVYQLPSEVIKSELEKEEVKFRKTLNAGLKELERIAKQQNNEIWSHQLFDLYQSFGFPPELSLEIAKEKNIRISTRVSVPLLEITAEILKPRVDVVDNILVLQEINNEILKHQELSRTASAGMFKGGLADVGEQTTKLHTAAHLMLAALRQVLGAHVGQKGSNITAERLRFDFSHPAKMTPEQIKQVEDLVNEQIKLNVSVDMEEMSLDDAKACGATGAFESKYGNRVKVYSIGGFSREICGGPHARNTGELGHFKILKEESSSSGVRRIKAVLE
jgi:alanyl-tRNA synthetase